MAQCWLGIGGQQWAQEGLCPHMHRAGCGVYMEPHSREKVWECPGLLKLQTAQLEKHRVTSQSWDFHSRAAKAFSYPL